MYGVRKLSISKLENWGLSQTIHCAKHLIIRDRNVKESQVVCEQTNPHKLSYEKQKHKITHSKTKHRTPGRKTPGSS